jgi:hypothetical protein
MATPWIEDGGRPKDTAVLAGPEVDEVVPQRPNSKRSTDVRVGIPCPGVRAAA